MGLTLEVVWPDAPPEDEEYQSKQEVLDRVAYFHGLHYSERPSWSCYDHAGNVIAES